MRVSSLKNYYYEEANGQVSQEKGLFVHQNVIAVCSHSYKMTETITLLF